MLGSIFTSLYASSLDSTSFARLPGPILGSAKNSVAVTLHITDAASTTTGPGLLDGVPISFISGLHIACTVAASICALGAWDWRHTRLRFNLPKPRSQLYFTLGS